MLRCLAATVLLWGGAQHLRAQEREATVGVGPEPSPTPISWESDFKYVPPRRIEVQLAGAEKPEVYWYMLYTVTNTSNTTQYFYPTFELVTEELRVIGTDMGISPLVFEAIRERHQITHKYLVHPTKAIGELRTGADYARESVAIWRATDVNVNEFTIYVAGLSGEARILRNPAYDPDKPQTTKIIGADGREREVTVNPKYFTLRKTLQLRYVLPASERARARVEPSLDDARWIMR
ncbi:MAG: hypothetical protein ACE5I3_08295 [Phycisphaerae bacterium]